jgi:hypothetical protein
VAVFSKRAVCDGRAHASRTQVGTRALSAAGGYATRYAVGVIPNIRLKLVVNEPTLRNPTLRQMSETGRSVERSSDAARSSLRAMRYSCGDSPKARRNSRLKCACERRAARASVGTSSGSR